MFKVYSPEDYYKLPAGDKTYFINRLYKAFKKSIKYLDENLPKNGGVNFLFETSGDLQKNNTNLPTEAFLKKLNFYSNQTIVTFPFKKIKDSTQLRIYENKPKSTWTSKRNRGQNHFPIIFGEIEGIRTPVGGSVLIKGDAYHIDPFAFKDFLEVVTMLRPAINAGMTYITPDFSDKKMLFTKKNMELYQLILNIKNYFVNFQEELNFENLPKRDHLGSMNLFLPHFTNIPIEYIIEIRENENQLYMEMQRRLECLFYKSSQTESEEILYNYLKEVDLGVRELNRKFNSIQVNYKRKNIYMGIRFIAASLLLLAPLECANSITALLGSTSVFDFFGGLVEKQNSKRDLIDDKFYLPWQIFKDN